MVGKNIKVIIDSLDDEYYIGRSEKDAPEVDGEVFIESKNNKLEIGKIYDTEIIDCGEYDLFAKLIIQ